MILSFCCGSCLYWVTYLHDKSIAWQYLVLFSTLYSAHLHPALADKIVDGQFWM